MVSTTKKRQAGSRFPSTADRATRYLRELTSNLDWGYTWDDGPRHNNTIDDIEAFLGGEAKYLRKLALKHFRWHYAGETTYYFAGNGYREAPRTLAMVDIDVHKAGSPAEARRYADELRGYFPDLYTEGSTGGRGVHQYLIVEKNGAGAESVNLALKTLDLWCKAVMYLGGYDLDVVEIKGTCPEVCRKRDGSIKVKAGQLAKLPREIDRRLEEFRGTAVFTTRQLVNLGPHIATLAERAGRDAETVRAIREAGLRMAQRPGLDRLKALREAVLPLKKRWEMRGDEDPVETESRVPMHGHTEGSQDQQMAAPTTIPSPSTVTPGGDAAPGGRDGVTRKKRVQSGSCDSPRVGDDLARRIGTDLRRLVNNNWDETLVPVGNLGRRKVAPTRKKVVKEDLAVTVAIYKHIATCPNRDNSVPVAWARALWDDLKERGYTGRAFDPSRYAACRDYMTTKGWIAWEDRGYTIGREIDGSYVKGEATRHGASGYLIGFGEEVKDEALSTGGEEEGEREDIGRNTIPASPEIPILGYIRSIHGNAGRPVCRGWVGETPGRLAA